MFVGCSKSKSIPNDHGAISALQNKTFFDEVGAVKAYNPNSPYAVSMSECIYAYEVEKSCVISKLPLLGLGKSNLTISDILNRTMISHDFLGVAFRQFLVRLNPEVLQMFGSVNAIVISDKINPSFYYSNTGAIYLSGNYFWSNLEEFKITSQAKDAREGFGTSLQFTTDHDYLKNGKSINTRAQDQSRTYDEMVLPVTRLLFHELTHANDFFPRSVYSSINFNQEKTFADIAFERYSTSALVSSNMPSKLSSSRLNHFGQVLFRGADPTALDNSVLASDIANEFKNDLATDFYSYSSPREDLAMIAEESLTLYYFNSYRYVVVIKFPYSNYVVPADYDYPIAWGQKGRVLLPAIKERALFAISNDLGDVTKQKASLKFETLKTIDIPANTPWDLIGNL